MLGHFLRNWNDAYQDENIGGVPHLLAVEHHQQHQGVPDDAEDGDEREDDGHDVRDQHLEAGLIATLLFEAIMSYLQLKS